MWQHIESIIVLTLLSLTASATAARITPRETNNCEGRETPGPICESCELLSTCVRHSSGWVNIPIEMCDTQNGFFCNSRLGMCSNATGSCHPFNFEGHFPCTSHGVFPDPYDCQKYHMCYYVGSTLVAASVDCGGDKAFNAANGQCSLNLAHAVCQQRQFECQHVGDAFAWPSNPNIFYICKATSSDTERMLYPTLYRCADGEYFDGYYCRTGTPSGTAATPSNPGDTSSTSTTPSSATPTTCSLAGLQVDPEDCRKYYYCSAVNGTRRHLDCPTGTYYNAALSSCTAGQC